MSGPTLKVVADNDAPSVSEMDIDLNLGELERDEEAGDVPSAEGQPERAANPLGRLMRLIGFVAMALLVLLAALLLMRGNRPPQQDAPLVTAKVEVLEAALAARKEDRTAEVQSVSLAAESGAAPVAETETPAFQQPVALQGEVMVKADTGEAMSRMREEILGVIAELRQVTNSMRDDLADQARHVQAMQGELAALQASGDATNQRVDGLSVELAQVRQSLETQTAQKAQQVAVLQRKLQQQRVRAPQSAVNPVRPPFVLVTITQWGGDALATVSINGADRDLGLGDVFNGWRVAGINDRTLTLTRLQDGATATLGAGG